MNTQTLSLDGTVLTRVGYSDVTIPREYVGLGADAAWRSPLWCDGENVRIGAQHFDAADVPIASFLGHLAVSPLHLASGECSVLHEDPPAAWSLLQKTAEDARLLNGPLWPTPGFGRWEYGAFVAGSSRANHG